MEKEEALGLIEKYDWASGTAAAAYQFCHPFMVGFMRLRDIYPYAYPFVFLTFKKSIASQLTPEEFTYEHIKQLYDQPEKTNEIKRRWEKEWNAFKEWCPTAVERLGELDDQALAQRYEEFMERFFDLWAPTLPVDLMGTYTETTLLTEFKEAVNVAQSEAVEQYAILCQPQQESFVGQEHASLVAMKGAPDFEERLAAHQQRFYWVENNYRDIKVLSKEYFRKKVEELEEEKEGGEEEERDLAAAQERLFAELGIQGRLKEHLLLTQELSVWQDERREMQMRANHFLNELLREASKRIGIGLQLTYWLTYDEMKSALRDGDAPATERLQERTRHFVQVLEQPEQETIFEGEDAEAIIEAFSRKEHATTLQGVVASKAGKERLEGVVAVVIDVATDNFPAGSILVASMTRPEYVPLMKKAAAIITDEGGITSHAAIVSREMGKPCIIGTRHATKILRSGSKVRLDFTTGEIAILP